MSTDRDVTRIVRAWLSTDEHESPDRVLGAVLEALDTTPQRRATWWPARRLQSMNGMIKYGLAAAVIVIAALLGYQYLVAPNVGDPEPAASADASPPQAASPSAASVRASLPALSLPGSRGGPPGEYGWEGGPGNMTGMHRVVGNAEVTAMLFAVGQNCLERTAGQHPVAVRVAGLEGVSVEPYVPAVMFINVGDEITRAYALDVDGRTLCVFVTWHPTTSDRDRVAAFEILESLRAEPIGRDRIRITFTLRNEWDTG